MWMGRHQTSAERTEREKRRDEFESHHDGRPRCSDVYGFDPLLDKLRHEHPEHRRGDIAAEAEFEND
jgi:hypothetical protein